MKFIKLIAFAFVQAARASNNFDDIAAAGGNAEVDRQLANETETTTASTVVAESSEAEVAVNTTAAPEVDPDGFASVDGDFSMVSSLTINGGVEGMQVTIQPSAVPFVSTYPPDVEYISLTVDGESLTIEIDGEAADGISPKLRIGLPPDQVKSISPGGGGTEILNGFTSVEKLQVAWSKIQADLTSNLNPDLQVIIPVSQDVNVIADVVGYVELGAISKANIQAETVSKVMVSSSSQLTVDGNVGSGIVTSSSSLTVTGDIEGHIDASSSSTVSANTISGSVKASWSSTVYASSCKNVQVVKFSASQCHRGSVKNGGPLGSSTTIATSAVMMFATLLVL